MPLMLLLSPLGLNGAGIALSPGTALNGPNCLCRGETRAGTEAADHVCAEPDSGVAASGRSGMRHWAAPHMQKQTAYMLPRLAIFAGSGSRHHVVSAHTDRHAAVGRQAAGGRCFAAGNEGGGRVWHTPAVLRCSVLVFSVARDSGPDGPFCVGPHLSGGAGVVSART
jgi:hypothetical protein